VTLLIQEVVGICPKLTDGVLRMYKPLSISATPIIFLDEVSCIIQVWSLNIKEQCKLFVSFGTDIRLKEKFGKYKISVKYKY
jgi:hypothetical protein